MDTHTEMVIFSRYNVFVFHVRIVMLTFAFYNQVFLGIFVESICL